MQRPARSDVLGCRIDGGIPRGFLSYTHVVHEDPVQAGLVWSISKVRREGGERSRDGQRHGAHHAPLIPGEVDDPVPPDLHRICGHVIQAKTGIEIPHDDPEAFLKASARAGVLYIDR